MASDQLVTSRIILEAELELQRRGPKDVQSHLEKIEPDLFSYFSEHCSMIYQKLMALGGRPRDTQRTYLVIQDLLLVCLMALRQANLKLWEQSIEDTPLARIAGPNDNPPAPPDPTRDAARKAILGLLDAPMPAVLELLYAAEKLAYRFNHDETSARCRTAIELITSAKS